MTTALRAGDSTGLVRVGVVGTTPYAESHIAAAAAHPRAVLAGIAGRDAGRATEVANRHGAGAAFTGWQSMIDSGAIDAVMIVAPDALHEPIAIAALARGLHVLCEKPLARTSVEAGRMVQAADGSGLVTMSYFALRNTPHHRYLAELVRKGTIGTVRSAAFSLAHGFFRSGDYNWRFDASRGGGVLADLGCYLFDLARWYVGDVVSVTAHGARHVARPHPDGVEYTAAPDTTLGALTFENGAHATYEASVVSTIGPGHQRNTVQLQGEHGRLELDHTFARAELRLIRADSLEIEVIAVPADFPAPSGDADFIDAILAGRPVTPSFVDGWRVQQVVEAAEQAMWNKTWTDTSTAPHRGAGS